MWAGQRKHDGQSLAADLSDLIALLKGRLRAVVEESVVRESHLPHQQFVIRSVDPRQSPSNHKPASPLFSSETGGKNGEEEEETDRQTEKKDMRKKEGLIQGEEREKRE